MKQKDGRTEDAARLHGRAEAIARDKGDQAAKDLDALTSEEARRTFHELQVYQIELEMQNDELRRTQLELEAARARYFDLYDLAPVGYCTLSEKGLILAANLTAATLLGADRAALIKKPITRFIVREDQDIFYRHRKQLFETGAPQVCEMRMLKRDGTAFWARLDANATHDDDGAPVCRVVMSDIADLKRAEERQTLQTEILRHLNAFEDAPSVTQRILLLLKEYADVGAIGFRLRAGEDFPYFETDGFAPDFIEKERYLCSRGRDNEILRDAAGNTCLECMCGNVLCGRTNPSLPFFTEFGSFWTNSTTELLTTTSEEDRQARTRNRCHGEGFESVALIPLRSDKNIIGLLQLNDKRPGRFTPDLIQFIESIAVSLGIAVAREQAHETLRQSEERFRLAAQCCSDFIYERDLGTGLAQFFGGIDEHLRYPSGGFPRTLAGWMEHVHPMDLPRVLDAVRRSFEHGDRYDLEYRLLRGDGTYTDWWDRGFIVRGNMGKPITNIGAAQDITNRKRAEAQNRYQGTLLANVADAILATDRQFNVRYWNKAAERLYGWGEADVLGRHFMEFIQPRYTIESRRAVMKKIAEEGFWEGELLHNRCDGTCFPVQVTISEVRNAEDQVIGHVAINRDISEIKRVEAALRASEHVARATLNGLSSHIAILDQDGRIEAVNDAWRRFARDNGVLPNGVCEGGDYLAVCDATSGPDAIDAREFAKAIRDVLAGRLNEFSREYACHSPDEQRWFVGRVTTFPGNGPPRCVVAHENVTERKRAEEALKAGQEQLRALASELAQAEEQERRRIAAYLHDEICQLLASVRVKLGAWKARNASMNAPELLLDIERTIDQTINDMRLVTYDLSPPILFELGLGPALEWLGERLCDEYGIVFTFRDEGQTQSFAEGLASALYGVVRELLMNVVKHAQAKHLSVAVRLPADAMQVVVEDDGKGFEMSRYTGEVLRTGEHMGLFSVRERLRHFGGSLDIDSSPGRGTRATVAVPLNKSTVSEKGA